MGKKRVEAVVTHALRTKRSQLDVSSQSGRWDYSQLSVVAESLSFHMAHLAQRYGVQGVWFRFLGMNRLYLPLNGATGDEHNVFRESQALSQSKGSDLVSELIRWGMHVRCSPYIRFVATLALRLASIPINLVLFWPGLRHAILPRSVCSSYPRASHIAQAANALVTRAGILLASASLGLSDHVFTFSAWRRAGNSGKRVRKSVFAPSQVVVWDSINSINNLC